MWWLGSGETRKYFERVLREIAEVKQGITEVNKEQKELMSQITDWAAAEEADLTAISNTLNGVATGIANLDTLIQQLQGAGLSAADAAALDAVKSASGALVTQAAAISTVPPEPPV